LIDPAALPGARFSEPAQDSAAVGKIMAPVSFRYRRNSGDACTILRLEAIARCVIGVLERGIDRTGRAAGEHEERPECHRRRFAPAQPARDGQMRKALTSSAVAVNAVLVLIALSEPLALAGQNFQL
jgi:hypothetical protein